jgi:hypothetical protein
MVPQPGSGFEKEAERVNSNGSANGNPFRVTLDQQRLAEALAEELSENDVSIHTENGDWIVSINEAKGDELVVRVLDATRATLSAQPTASAIVQLDGREYVMRGEDQSPKTVAPPSSAAGTAEVPSI